MKIENGAKITLRVSQKLVDAMDERAAELGCRTRTQFIIRAIDLLMTSTESNKTSVLLMNTEMLSLAKRISYLPASKQLEIMQNIIQAEQAELEARTQLHELLVSQKKHLESSRTNSDTQETPSESSETDSYTQEMQRM